MKEIKTYARGAVISSLAVVIILTRIANCAGRAEMGGAASIIGYISILAMASCAIMLWIKCVKKYVHFVIEQKMGNIVTEK
jgi:hypothetical protein